MSEDIAKAVGHIPSGLFVICSKDDEVIDGYLASWVQQISFKPLLVSFAITTDRCNYDLIVSGEVFTINTVAKESANYMKYFWNGYDSDNNPFKSIPHEISKSGGVILKEACSTIECKFVSKQKPGDHEIVVAKVIASYVNEEKLNPIVHIRKTGSTY